MTREFFFKNLWLWKCCKAETELKFDLMSANDLIESEWSFEFEQLCRNRLIFGAYRYGKLNDPGKPVYDRISSLIKRAGLYKKTGNLEHLVDIANIAMIEFEEGRHPLRHFKSIDDGDHAEKM